MDTHRFSTGKEHTHTVDQHIVLLLLVVVPVHNLSFSVCSVCVCVLCVCLYCCVLVTCVVVHEWHECLALVCIYQLGMAVYPGAWVSGSFHRDNSVGTVILVWAP